jgi:hypothetical protein
MTIIHQLSTRSFAYTSHYRIRLRTRIPGRLRQHAVRGYSEGRASPCSFVMHNVANISTAIQAAASPKPSSITICRAPCLVRGHVWCVYCDFLRGQ